MAEYIEREALEHHFMTKRRYLTKDLVMDAAYEVNKFPAADVAPVVRCGECERRNKSADLTYTVYCPWLKLQMRKTDFCSYGKRKDGERDG